MKRNLFVLAVVLMLVIAGCGSKPTLAELVESDDVVAGEEEVNASFAESGIGLRLKYSADGEDILVLSFVYEEYQNLLGRTQSEIDAEYVGQLNNLGLSANLDSLFEECEKTAGITLKCIRIQLVNADGTVICSQEYVDTK